MRIVERIIGSRRLILLAAAVMAFAGVQAALIMPRQEDSRIPEYWGLVVTPFPGADAEKVERLVVDPLEEHLAEVEEVKHVTTTMRAGVAVTIIELVNPLKDTDNAWDKVRRSLSDAKKEFPDRAGEPVLDDKMQDTESVVLAITGSSDPIGLLDAAKLIKKEFLTIPQVSRVTLIGHPGEQVTIEFDDSLGRRLGIDPRYLAQQLAERNLTIPGGSIKLGGKKVVIRLNDEYESIREIASAPILLPSGAAIPLGELAKVRRGPEEPAPAKMRFNLESAVGLGIIPKKGIDVVEFGRTVHGKLAELRDRFAPLGIQEVTFQPGRVQGRLVNLGQSLIMSIAIVAAVLVLAMGLRLGLIVAAVVPFVSLTSLAIFAWGGGILHQISIAAFVVALGMLVDNAIVVSENIQRRIDRGVRSNQAAVEAVRELAVPLAAATGTTLAAFIPMLLARSTTGDFTRSLPVIIITVLSVSYLFAVSFTPTVSAMVLRPRTEPRRSILTALSNLLSRLALERSRLILMLAGVAVAAAVVASHWVDRRFFPDSDRNQLLIDMRLPEGAHLDEIDAAASRVEHELAKLDRVTSFASFMGRGAPHFYYNVPRRPNSPHLAQIVVNVADLPAVAAVLKWTRDFASTELAGVEVVARRLEQGPPVDAPIEIRTLGWDLQDVQKTATLLVATLREIPE
ncbi:MAG: efflux RND transporter permease subunit, partial [Deltaproteobacteria bacterium]